MKNKFLTQFLVIAGAIGIAAAFLNAQPAAGPAGRPQPAYEYVAVRFMGGDKACVIWPDGHAEKIGDLVTAKRPGLADERMFQLCMAINLLSKKGFEPASLPSVQAHPDDLWMRRAIPLQP